MIRVVLSALALFALAGLGRADDHLVQATDPAHGQGLSLDSQPYQTNPAGHSGDLAPGQGSPFTGAETKTPATDTDAANDHANVQQRQPK